LLLFWILFNLFAVGMLLVDLRIFHRRGRVVHVGEALGWGAMWVALAAAFAAIVYFWQGHHSALEFVTAYVVEVSLSADNLFIFLVVFRYFAVPEGQQYRVLFWGILGALVLRGMFIGAGVGLIHRFHWIVYVFGILLIYSGLRLFMSGRHQIDPAKNRLLNAVRRIVPVTTDYHGGKFVVRDPASAHWQVTPLLMALMLIETADVLFAADSIPAVLGITLNAFLVYTSNVFAILGLRSMYFAVAGLVKAFRFLHYGLAVLLVVVGLKMLLADRYQLSTGATLCAIAAILGVSVAASVLVPQPRGES
jgi:TerC family integral membrane protein